MQAMHGRLVAKGTSMAQCKMCGFQPLTGRKTKFCSISCREQFWAARRQAIEDPSFSDPDPVINAFLQDFRELLEKHRDGVNRLGSKRKL